MGMNWKLKSLHALEFNLEGIWPERIQFYATELRIGDRWMRVYRVSEFPRQVEPGWLLPLFRFSRPHILRFFTYLLPTRESVGQMGRRLVVQRGAEAANAELGRLSNPWISQAVEDTDRLRAEVARGETRMAQVALLVAIHELSQDALEESAELLLGMADSMMLGLRCLRYQQEMGFLAMIPGGSQPEPLREMDTSAWATGFPFAGDEMMHPHGQIWGDHDLNPSWVIIDRYQMPSPHSITLGWSGSGKSYFAKLEALRSRYRGINVAIIDPEGEYQVLRQAGAKVLRLGVDGQALGFDPFGLDGTDRENYDGQVEFVLRLIPRLIDGWSQRNQGQVLQVVYGQEENSVLSEQNVWDWIARLARLDQDTHDLVRIAQARWRQVAGSPTLAVPTLAPFIVYDLSRVSDRLKSAVYLVIAEMLARATMDRSQRLVIIDEAWYLINDPETAPYLESLFRRARKWGTALSLITQDFGDFTRSQAAEVCLRNSPLILLLRQHQESLNQLSQALHLNALELERVATAATGQGLLLASDDRIPLHIWSTKAEALVLQGQVGGLPSGATN